MNTLACTCYNQYCICTPSELACCLLHRNSKVCRCTATPVLIRSHRASTVQVAALAEAAGVSIDEEKPYAELWCAVVHIPWRSPLSQADWSG